MASPFTLVSLFVSGLICHPAAERAEMLVHAGASKIAHQVR